MTIARESLPPARENDSIDERETSATGEATSTKVTDRKRGLLLARFAIISIGGWFVLHQWYGLLDNRHNTHFSFEKIPGGFDSPIIRQSALVFLILAAIFAAIILILRSMTSTTLLARLSVIAMAIGTAVANVLLYPVGALDVFNYMIELKLAFHYDENPYLVTFAAYRTDSFALPAFLVDITLFYGPAWLLAMWIPTVVVGFTNVINTLIALKVFNVLLIAVTSVLIARYHHDHRLRWVAITLFVANPLVLFEGVANAHNDVLLTMFVIGAMLALQRRSPLAGPLLALSALVKLYTVVLVPIFLVVALKDRWGWKRTGVTVALTVFAVVITCAPYWGDGKLVDGLRGGLEQSQQMDHVSLFSITQQYAQEQEAQERTNSADYVRSRPSFEIVPEETRNNLRTGFTAVFAIASLLIAASVWKGRPPALAAAETLLLLFLLMTNLYAWYLIPIFALLALHPDRLSKIYITVATALGLFYYPMYVYAHFNTLWTRFEVHLFLSLFLTVPIMIYLAARIVRWRSTSMQPA